MLSTIITYIVLVIGGAGIVGLKFFFAIRNIRIAEEKAKKEFQMFMTRRRKYYA